MMARRDLPPNPVSDVRIEEVTGTTAFTSSRVAGIYHWWADIARRSGQLPRWQDFDIVDHRALAPYLFVVETPENGDFRFRLLGEVVIEMIGRNNVGELVRARPDDDYGHGLYDYYRDIVARRVCLKCRGTLAFAGAEHKRFESIDCPMVDERGQVGRIIGVMDYIR
jgi:hypothetical protein